MSAFDGFYAPPILDEDTVFDGLSAPEGPTFLSILVEEEGCNLIFRPFLAVSNENFGGFIAFKGHIYWVSQRGKTGSRYVGFPFLAVEDGAQGDMRKGFVHLKYACGDPTCGCEEPEPSCCILEEGTQIPNLSREVCFELDGTWVPEPCDPAESGACCLSIYPEEPLYCIGTLTREECADANGTWIPGLTCDQDPCP